METDDSLITFDEWLCFQVADAHTISVIIQWKKWNQRTKHELHYINYEQLLDLFIPDTVQ